MIRILVAVALLALAPAAHAQTPVRHSVEMAAPAPATWTRLGGVDQLVHEVHVTNLARAALRLTAAEIVEGDRVIASYAGAALDAAIGPVGAEPQARLVLEPGRRVTLYVNAPVSALPDSIAYRLRLEPVPEGDPILVTGPGSVVSAVEPLVFGPPLEGGPWAAVYLPEGAFGHRRFVYAVDGLARIPGRFAIDFFKVDAEGRRFGGTGERMDDSFGHGSRVLAVADAEVIAAVGDVPEAERLDREPITRLADATGNYVALRLEDGRIVFYEHLQPGLDVKVGDRVRRGQALGRLGLTGQGSEPHLHFHVADAASPLGAEGHPFLLEAFTVLGLYDDVQTFQSQGAWRRAPGFGQGQGAPAPLSVIQFDPTPAPD